VYMVQHCLSQRDSRPQIMICK